ncbi:ABC transporter permease [Povalibacter sp.]|uniref:ABC transporter permease n=1 Tax=Povalibacter sp. TaxID=1962978 RepID=UPI002F42DAAD
MSRKAGSGPALTASSMDTDASLTLRLEGRITAQTAPPIWKAAIEQIEGHPLRPVLVDASRLEFVDNVGLAMLFDLIRRERAPGAKVEVRALAPDLAAILQRYVPGDFAVAGSGLHSMGLLEQVGRATERQAGYLVELLGFVAACARALFRSQERQVSTWRDALDIATEAGANAVPIVLLIGFLMGVIIAFELGQVARQFGAVIFVVDGVGSAVLRELGALMTAVVVAGRTGAAFAAQLGSQKVNEELDALATFGLDPIEFLVLPRLLAMVVVVPLLTVLADFVGLCGGVLVLMTFDVTYLQFYTELLGAVKASDLLLGLVKAACYGLTIAAVGCHQGLATGAGATAVGQSATRAVVSSIVLIIVIDGFFAVLTS